jgi:hypothetical protein
MWPFANSKSHAQQVISDALVDARRIRQAAEHDAVITRADAVKQCSEISRTLEALLVTSAKAEEVMHLAVLEAARVRTEAFKKLTAADILEFIFARLPASGTAERMADLEASRLRVTTALKEAYDAHRSRKA